ncbi:MAG: hypothetical protein ACFFEU_01665 [Candidatus Thorarchaeota archaeon]
MEWRRRKVKDSEPETDACRIPHKIPGEGKVSSAVRVAKPPTYYGPSESTVIIGVLICMMFLLLTPLWNLTYIIPASVSFHNTGEIQGQPGFELKTEGWEGSQNVVILNSTPFPGSPEWSAYAYYATNVVGEKRNDGYYVDFQGIPGLQHVSFVRRLHIAIDDYSASSFEASLSVLSGTVNATLRVEFSDYQWGSLVSKEAMESIREGAETTLTVETPLPLLRTIAEQWIVKANVYITLESITGARVVIKGFNARATGNVPLHPLVADLQSTVNESLYDTPFTRFLLTPPYLLVRRQGTLENATIWPERANETLFVAEGNYTVDAGWACDDYYPDPFDAERMDFRIESNMKTVLQVRMRAVRLDLVGFKLMSLERFELSYGYWENQQYDFWAYSEPPIVLSDYVYLAPLSGQLIFDGKTVDTLQNDPVTGYYGGSFNLEGEITTDGTHHLELVSIFPVIPVGITFLGLGHFLTMIVMGFLIFLLYRKYREVKTVEDARSLVENPRFIPVLLFIAGGITPWYMITEHLSGSILFSATMYFFVPMVAEVIVAADLSTVLAFPFGWRFMLLLSGILYWYPLTKIVTSLIAPQPKDKQHPLRHLGMITALCIATLVPTLLAGIKPAIGIGLVICGLVAWIMQYALQRGNEEDSIQAGRTVEGKEDE